MKEPHMPFTPGEEGSRGVSIHRRRACSLRAENIFAARNACNGFFAKARRPYGQQGFRNSRATITSAATSPGAPAHAMQRLAAL
jgi:hypothetical protein